MPFSAKLSCIYTWKHIKTGTKQLSAKPETLLVFHSFTPLHYLIFLPVPLCRKAATHNSEIRHLYEEMEAQIKNEKDRLLLKVGEHKQNRQGCRMMCVQSLGDKQQFVCCSRPDFSLTLFDPLTFHLSSAGRAGF